jgi:inhibitor of KinA
VPVCYDRDFAVDLDEVATRSRLMPAEVVSRHASASYRVACVGFTPGFPYLSGLPNELATPRRLTPRKLVAAGSVGIGGNQTGIYPQDSPGGWNIIGRTPLRLFDPSEVPPSLFVIGDTVRFRQITRDEFEQLSR